MNSTKENVYQGYVQIVQCVLWLAIIVLFIFDCLMAHEMVKAWKEKPIYVQESGHEIIPKEEIVKLHKFHGILISRQREEDHRHVFDRNEKECKLRPQDQKETK